MELIKQLQEAITRTERLKTAFGKAIDAAIEKYVDQFKDGKGEQVKDTMLDKFDPNLNKGQITTMLKELGVENASDIAQTIISQAHKFDTELSRASA